jgi:ribosomal protein S8
MHLELTSILSKCAVAEGKKKKLVTIFINNSCLTLLNCLWVNGWIYGYIKDGSKVTIFLKTSCAFFSNLVFLRGKKQTLVKLKKSLVLDPHMFCLLMSSQGVFSGRDAIRVKVGGNLLGKL